MIIMNYVTAFFLIVLGLYCMIVYTNMIRIIIGMSLMDYGVNLMIVTAGFTPGGTAPIFTITELTRDSFFVDPIPQALTLTSIVIGACTTALALALTMRLKKKYGTMHAEHIRRLHG